MSAWAGSTRPGRRAASCSPRASGSPVTSRATCSASGPKTPIGARCSSAASDLLQGAVTIRLDQLERVDRQLLHERHLVSKELAGLEREARPRPGAALVVQGTVGVMVNEEVHLRLL